MITKQRTEPVSYLDLEVPILNAAHLASALEKLITTDILRGELTEGELQTVMETLAERLACETKAAHDLFNKAHDLFNKAEEAPRPPLKAVAG